MAAPELEESTITIVVDNTTYTLSSIAPGIRQLPALASVLSGAPPTGERAPTRSRGDRWAGVSHPGRTDTALHGGAHVQFNAYSVEPPPDWLFRPHGRVVALLDD